MNLLTGILNRLFRSGRNADIATMPGRIEKSFPPAILAIQDAHKAALRQESALASKHRLDSYYTTSHGHNIGKDELITVLRAKTLDLTPKEAERDDPVLYANRLPADLEVIKQNYRASEEDPEDYGIGTLHSLSRALAPFGKAVL